jgi:hypothetical protein
MALAVLAGLHGLALGQQGQPTPPKQGSDITVTDSPGAITGQTINIGNMYQIAQRDRVTEQFVVTLRNHNYVMSETWRQIQPLPIYLYALNEPMPQPPTNDPGWFYMFIVGEYDPDDFQFGAELDRCEVRPGTVAMGGILRASVEGSSAHLTGRVMTRDDGPLLQQICQGLRQPLSTSIGGQGDPSLLVFDDVARQVGFVVLLLFPEQSLSPEFEQNALLHYWTTALLGRYVRTPRPEALFSLGVLSHLRGLPRGRMVDIPAQLPFNFTPPPSYPRQAREEFGPRVERLETDWNAYLAGAAMTFDNQRRPVLANGHVSHLVPRFRMNQVGSREFWTRGEDFRDFSTQLNCLAGNFLIDRGYVAPATYIVPGQCPLDELRLPAP